MARKAKPKTRRSRKAKSFGLVNAAENYILGSAITQGLFGTTLYNFATEGWLRTKTHGSQMGSSNSYSLSASELVQSAMGDSSHMSQAYQDGGGISKAVKYNLQANGGRALATLIFAPMLFKGVKKLASRPINMVNRMLPGGTVKL